MPTSSTEQSSSSQSSAASGESATCNTAPTPCAALTIKMCAPGQPDCTEPVAPFDAMGVRCFLDAFIAGTPARLHLLYTANAGQYVTYHDYVLFGDSTVSDDTFVGADITPPKCEQIPSTLEDQAYLATCKASTTDADLLACFRSAVKPSTGSGATCTNHLGCK